MSFIGEANQGYVVVAEAGQFAPNRSEAVVLAWNRNREFHQYVTWRAGRDGSGKAVYWAGNYFTDASLAYANLTER